MERLTDMAQGYCEVYCDFWAKCTEEPENCQWKNEVNLYNRLREYEATGLEPEQIIRARDTLECFDNIGIKRGNEIVKAEQEGRLVVLPCKVGDTVYRTWSVPGREPVITAHVMDEVEFIVKWTKHFGKTVFLTREEAEKAMEGQK